MKKKSIFTLVVALMMLLAFTTSCFAATAPAKKPAAKPAVKAPVKPAVKPAVKAAVPAAAAIKAPATLTGDKAKAYVLLAGKKYSGKATGDFKAELQKIVIIGDKTMYVTTKSTGAATLADSKDVPGLAGGDFKAKKEALVPYTELVSGNAKAIEAILKEAKTVTVAGNVITITNSKPPVSITGLLNSVSSKVKWMKNRLNVETLKVTVGPTAVTSIEITLKGTADGTTDMPATVTGKITY